MTRDDASAAQLRAADPAVSTWLAANAGSGKTRVLTDRVARLLLAGTKPQNILCLTYTKAAAAEMQNRLFLRLGGWAMLPDDRLLAELKALGEDVAEAALPTARRLFAQAMEVPGGLRIQTIHAFCASLLRRFPLEAGVSPDFTEMDDRAGAMLRGQVAERLALEAPDLTDAFLAFASGDDPDPMLQMITGQADLFAGNFDENALREALDLPGTLEMKGLVADLLGSGELALIHALIPHLKNGSVTDQKAAATLAGVTGAVSDLAILEKLFLYGESAKEPFGAKTGKFPTRATREAAAYLMDGLDDLMQRVEDGRRNRLALLTLARSRALHDYAGAFLDRLFIEKTRRALVDFDDLIARANHLLGDPAVARWVLWKLDGGIDHILVDEAQDTSPRQWAVIRGLTQEFAAGHGAREVERTIFVVGDRKQSIYSFQGADPDEFDRMRRHFADEIGKIGQELRDGTLAWSFRSAPAILQAVDAVFGGDNRRGLGEEAEHFAYHDRMPGRVDLWPPVPNEEDEDQPADWTAPVDHIGRRHPARILAERIADQVKVMTERGLIPDGDGAMRQIRAGDILILVQRRSDLFHSLIREMKARKVPVAGADRLRVGAELAVRDIGALLRFLALAEDDLSLAAALRSPLFGWSEADLYALATSRKGTLWEALRHGDHAGTLAILDDLRRQADFLRPYDLINRLLVRHDGRRRLLARLGPEAEDGIDALLSQALAYERVEVPGLTGFTEWMQTDESDFKRQLDSRGDAVRVMTVHGSKGLEAPIVILPDCAKRQPRGGARILPMAGGAIWAAPKAEATDAQRILQDEARERDEDERRRLLYVAMTRAESWLIVAAAGDTGESTESWHSMVAAGLTSAGAAEVEQPGGMGQRLESGDWATVAGKEEQSLPAVTETVPVDPAPVAPPDRSAAPIAPSALGGAVILPGDTDEDETGAALARGRLIHRLLENLPDAPADERPVLARAIIAADPDATLAGAGEDMIGRCLAMAESLPPGGLAEAGVTGILPDGRRMSGQIDRLDITPERVTLTDYKSNRITPGRPEDVPEGILRQMGAYAHALAEIWPGRQIEAQILWTATGEVTTLPPALIMAALRRACAP